MAAGLAHELNNPAAAAQRAADAARRRAAVINYALRAFVEAGVERTEAEQLLALHQQALDGAAGRTALEALDAADAEDALLEALEDSACRSRGRSPSRSPRRASTARGWRRSRGSPARRRRRR